MTDLEEIINENKDFIFKIYVRKNKVYLKDAQTGERIMICNLDENKNKDNDKNIM